MAILNSLVVLAELLVLPLVLVRVFSTYVDRGLPQAKLGTVLSSKTPASWAFYSVFYLSFCVLGPTVLALAKDSSRLADISFWATLVVLSMPAMVIIWAALKEYFTYRLTYDKDRITVTSYWRGSQEYRWVELREVVVDTKNRRYELYYSEARQIFVREDQLGSDELVAQIRQHGNDRDLLREF